MFLSDKSGFMVAVLVVFLTCTGSGWADSSIDDIVNYREYDANFSSSGQPDAGQLKLLSEAGFKRIVYIAFNDNGTAIAAEDRTVKSLGMDYLHIPVDFENPTSEDFEDFAAVMNRDQKVRTLLHCQVNYRASTFSFLYRVIYLGVPVAQAKKDLDGIWQPDETWYRFIVEVLRQHGMSHQCDDCDWGEHEFADLPRSTH